MPKPKTFNISKFVDESAEGVKVAEQQIQKEKEAQNTEVASQPLANAAQTTTPQTQMGIMAGQPGTVIMPNGNVPGQAAVNPGQVAIQADPFAMSAGQVSMMGGQPYGYGQMAQPINMPIGNVIPQTHVVYPNVEQENRAEKQAKSKRGRKKSLRTIERINGKIVFLEKETDGDLSRISTLERFDKQDIIRTALYQWLQKHYDGNMLDTEGRAEIIEYIQRTTTFEDL